MTDKRSLSVIAAALVATAGTMSALVTAADAQAVPLNLHKANDLAVSFAADAADFIDQLATAAEAAPAVDVAGIEQKIDALRAELVTAGVLLPAAPPAPPAPAPAANPATSAA